jgi:Ca2+-binding EF-hand superfamily protein
MAAIPTDDVLPPPPPPPPPPPFSCEASTSSNKSRYTSRNGSAKRLMTRQSMFVRPGESRKRRFTFDGGQKEELHSLFTLLDTDMDRKLSPEQVYVAMAAVGVTPTEDIKRAIRKRLPKNSTVEGIGYDVFERIVKSTLTAQPVQRRDLQVLLNLYDNTGSGKVSTSILRRLLQIPTTSRSELTPFETDQIFEELGLGNDGLIEFSHYVDDVATGFARILDHRPLAHKSLTM